MAIVTLFNLPNKVKLPILRQVFRELDPVGKNEGNKNANAISVNRRLTEGQPRALCDIPIPESYFGQGYDSLVHAFGAKVPMELKVCHT